MKNKKTILFICTHNSSRSQMAEALVNTLLPDKYLAYSAGTQPTKVSSYTIEVMKEIGIDISKQKSKSITEFMDLKFDILVTVCDRANQTCPIFPGKKVLHKGFTDPATSEGTKKKRLEIHRKIRDDIMAWIRKEFR